MAAGIMDIMDLIQGFQKFQVLYTCTSAGIFEELSHNPSGGMSAETLAVRLSLNPESLIRIMNAAVNMGLLTKHSVGSTQNVYFSNSKVVSKHLTKSSPGSIRPLVLKMGDLYKLWGNLSETLKEEGCPKIPMMDSFTPNKKTEDMQIIKPPKKLYGTPTKQLEFMQVMHMFSMRDAEQVLQAFDLSEFTTACDLGGGTGTIASSLARKYPELNVTSYDLSHVTASAQHFNSDKPSNLTFKSGNFFTDPLPAADLYILSHIIHDWGSKDVDRLLQKIHKSLPKGGALLVLEKCLDDSKTSPEMTVFFDVGMLMLSEGKERNAQEYRTLLKRHSYTNILIKFLPKSMYRDAILARKE